MQRCCELRQTPIEPHQQLRPLVPLHPDPVKPRLSGKLPKTIMETGDFFADNLAHLLFGPDTLNTDGLLDSAIEIARRKLPCRSLQPS
jgi:hypothetical protein